MGGRGAVTMSKAGTMMMNRGGRARGSDNVSFGRRTSGARVKSLIRDAEGYRPKGVSVAEYRELRVEVLLERVSAEDGLVALQEAEGVARRSDGLERVIDERLQRVLQLGDARVELR